MRRSAVMVRTKELMALELYKLLLKFYFEHISVICPITFDGHKFYLGVYITVIHCLWLRIVATVALHSPILGTLKKKSDTSALLILSLSLSVSAGEESMVLVWPCWPSFGQGTLL